MLGSLQVEGQGQGEGSRWCHQGHSPDIGGHIKMIPGRLAFRVIENESNVAVVKRTSTFSTLDE